MLCTYQISPKKTQNNNAKNLITSFPDSYSSTPTWPYLSPWTDLHPQPSLKPSSSSSPNFATLRNTSAPCNRSQTVTTSTSIWRRCRVKTLWSFHVELSWRRLRRRKVRLGWQLRFIFSIYKTFHSLRLLEMLDSFIPVLLNIYYLNQKPKFIKLLKFLKLKSVVLLFGSNSRCT